MGEAEFGAKEVIVAIIGIGLTSYLWANDMSSAGTIHVWMKTEAGTYIFIAIMAVIWIHFWLIHNGIAASGITFGLVFLFLSFIHFVERARIFGVLIDCIFTMILVYCVWSVFSFLLKIPGRVNAIVKAPRQEPTTLNSEEFARLPTIEPEKIILVGNDYSADQYFVGQGIPPPERVANIFKHIGIPADENILIFLDTSFMRSGKMGLVVGHHGIYFRSDEGHGFISWPELERGSLFCDKERVLHLGPYRFESAASLDNLPRDKLLENEMGSSLLL